MNNTVMRKITLTADYQALASEKTVCSFSIFAYPDNVGDAIFKGDTGDEVPLVQCQQKDFVSVNLASIEVKGTAGDVITVFGGTW